MLEQDKLRWLAAQGLDEAGQETIEKYLSENNLFSAKLYLLGAIDALWMKGKISENEAKQAYKMLNIGPEEASKARQQSNCWK